METSNRQTREFVTSGGHKVVIKTYCSGREWQDIQDVYLKDAKINMIGNDVKVEGFSPKADSLAKEKAVELLVVSIDGKTTSVLADVFNLPFAETAEILAQVDAVQGKKKEGAA